MARTQLSACFRKAEWNKSKELDHEPHDYQKYPLFNLIKTRLVDQSGYQSEDLNGNLNRRPDTIPTITSRVVEIETIRGKIPEKNMRRWKGPWKGEWDGRERMV